MMTGSRSTGVELWTSCLVVAAMFVVLLGCFDPDPMEGEISRLISKTASENSVITQRQDPYRNERSVTASWTFHWDGDWKRYSEWVKSNLRGEYRILDETNTQLMFQRANQGDMFTLTIDSIDSSSEVRVTLIGQPF